MQNRKYAKRHFQLHPFLGEETFSVALESLALGQLKTLPEPRKLLPTSICIVVVVVVAWATYARPNSDALARNPIDGGRSMHFFPNPRPDGEFCLRVKEFIFRHFPSFFLFLPPHTKPKTVLGRVSREAGPRVYNCCPFLNRPVLQCWESRNFPLPTTGLRMEREATSLHRESWSFRLIHTNSSSRPKTLGMLSYVHGLNFMSGEQLIYAY